MQWFDRPKPSRLVKPSSPPVSLPRLPQDIFCRTADIETDTQPPSIISLPLQASQSPSSILDHHPGFLQSYTIIHSAVSPRYYCERTTYRTTLNPPDCTAQFLVNYHPTRKITPHTHAHPRLTGLKPRTHLLRIILFRFCSHLPLTNPSSLVLEEARILHHWFIVRYYCHFWVPIADWWFA